MTNTQGGSIMKKRILLEKHEGGAPNLQGLYRTSESWIRFCRGYQWTQGYDINVSDERKEEYTTLSCSTHSQCTFSITALYQLFNRPGDAPEVFGQYGYRISSSEPQDSKPFIPKHSHEPHYVPLNLEQENARRAHLQPGDPSLDNPPLIRTRPQRGFASEDTPMPEDVEMRSRATYGGAAAAAGGGGGGAIQNSQAQRDRSSSLVSHVKPEPQHNNTATAQSPASSSSLYQAPPSYRSTPVHADHYAVPPPPPSRQIQPPPPPTPTPTPSLSVQYQAPVIAPPTPLSTPAPSSIPRTPSVDPSLTQTPLGSFLLEISPSFLEILPNLPSAGLPLSTPPQDLIDVDMDDSIVWDMFQQVEGIKLAHCALAAEGVRKAKLRSQSAAPGTRLDPKIVSGGLEQAKTKAWILRRIAMGEAMAAATPAQSHL